MFQPAIEGYELISPLGEGAFGQVFKARHVKLNRIVAIKVSRPLPCGDDTELMGEIRRLSHLNHPNIVTVYDAGLVSPESSAPCAFIAMEFLNERTLRESFPAIRTQYSLKDNLQMFIDLLDAVIHAHELGIYHCDLHAENVLLTKYGDRHVPKIADFGLPSRFQPADAASRAAKDVKQMLVLFWTYFYFPQIRGILNAEELEHMDLISLRQRVTTLAQFRLSDHVLRHEAGVIVTKKAARERRLASTVVLAYALDHPMQRSLAVEIQPYLPNDIRVDQSDNDTYQFQLNPAVTHDARAYLLLLLSLSDVYHHDHKRVPHTSVTIDGDIAAGTVEAYSRALSYLDHACDLEQHGYALTQVTQPMANVFARDISLWTSVDTALAKLIIYNSILFRFGRQALGEKDDDGAIDKDNANYEPAQIDEAEKGFSTDSAETATELEQIVGVAWAMSRISYEGLRSILHMQRSLQAFLDLLGIEAAVVRRTHTGLALIQADHLKCRDLAIEIDVSSRENSRMEVCIEDENVQLHLALSRHTIAALWAALTLDELFRLPASQVFESGEVSILARYGVGLRIRIGDSAFTLISTGTEEALQSIRRQVAQSARSTDGDIQKLAYQCAQEMLKSERQFYDRSALICPDEYEDRNYKSAYHKGIAMYGSLEYAPGISKEDALQKIANEFDQAQSMLAEALES